MFSLFVHVFIFIFLIFLHKSYFVSTFVSSLCFRISFFSFTILFFSLFVIRFLLCIFYFLQCFLFSDVTLIHFVNSLFVVFFLSSFFSFSLFPFPLANICRFSNLFYFLEFSFQLYFFFQIHIPYILRIMFLHFTLFSSSYLNIGPLKTILLSFANRVLFFVFINNFSFSSRISLFFSFYKALLVSLLPYFIPASVVCPLLYYTVYPISRRLFHPIPFTYLNEYSTVYLRKYCHNSIGIALTFLSAKLPQTTFFLSFDNQIDSSFQTCSSIQIIILRHIKKRKIKKSTARIRYKTGQH